MPTLGQINQLNVIEKVADGLYLDGRELEEIFLPAWEAPKDAKEGDVLDVFLYLDGKDTIMATMVKPTAVVGECALLKVLSAGNFGAFLDWGLPKDLLLPHAEQAYPVEEGHSYVVYVFQDSRSGRIAATTKLHFHLEESSGPYQKGEQVDLLVAAKSELGYKAVINGAYLGLIYEAELSQALTLGDRMKGWIKDVRDDGKVDLTINTLDNDTRDELEQNILDRLSQNEGSLPFSDKSPPEEIFQTFRVSKKNFKRAISGLYKKRLINIEPTSISLPAGMSNTKIIRPEKPREEKQEPPKTENTKERLPREKLSLSKSKSNLVKTSGAQTNTAKENDRSQKEHANAHIYKKRI